MKQSHNILLICAEVSPQKYLLIIYTKKETDISPIVFELQDFAEKIYVFIYMCEHMYAYNIHMYDSRLQANCIGRLMVKLINLKERSKKYKQLRLQH